MAKAAENRPVIQLACTECRERTYTTEKNKKNDPEPARAPALLPALPPSHAAPRDEVTGPKARSSIGRALVSKTSGCRFESGRACQPSRSSA